MENKYLIVLGLLVTVGLGITAYTFTQGSIFTDDSCGFNLVEHPNTGDTYSNVSEYKTAFRDYTGANDTVVETHFETADFEIRNGNLYEKNNECFTRRIEG